MVSFLAELVSVETLADEQAWLANAFEAIYHRDEDDEDDEDYDDEDDDDEDYDDDDEEDDDE